MDAIIGRLATGPFGRPVAPCYSSGRMASTSHVRILRASDHPNPVRLVAEGLTDIWSRRRLARYLVEADLAKHGANTVLGNVWWFLDPLLQMMVYVVLVSIIFARPTPDYPLFIFAAILPWKWFSSTVTDAVTAVTTRERIIKQVAFPKLVLPVAATASGVVSFCFGLVPLLGLMIAFYADRLSPFLVLIPVVAAVQFLLTLSVAIVLSAVNVFFRDIGNVARHALRLAFYLSPALYSIDHLASKPTLQQLMWLNPFTTLFESYRNLIYDGTWPHWDALVVLSVVAGACLLAAIALFKWLEPSFAKVL